MRKAHSDRVTGLGELLKAERERRGQITQKEAAEILEVDQPRFQRWESYTSDVEPDRALHERIRAFLQMEPAAYAQAVLEHSIRVKERRRGR